MTVHSGHSDPHGEAVLAVYSHAVSSPVAEWSYAHAEAYAAVVVFLLTLTAVQPVLAAVLALVVAVAMVAIGAVLSLREADGTCEQIIGEVRARGEDSR